MYDPTSPDGMPPLPDDAIESPLPDDAFTAMFDAVDRSIAELQQRQERADETDASMLERTAHALGVGHLPEIQAQVAQMRGHDDQAATTALDIVIAATYMREPTMRDGLLAVYQMGVDAGADADR